MTKYNNIWLISDTHFGDEDFYTYTLEDIYKRIDDIITLDYFLVITPVCIQLQYIKNDDIYHAETTTDDNMLETAYNMLLFVLKNILGREIK